MQSFSIYIPYADTTIFNVFCDGQRSATNSAHWEWTALYSDSPVRFAMFAPDIKSVVFQICFMSPPISNWPAVDRAFARVPANTSLIAVNFFDDSELSRVFDNFNSPSLADNIALTSAGVFNIASILRFLKSVNWSAVWLNTRSRALMVSSREEHMHRRYRSFATAQNWSIHAKYASWHSFCCTLKVFVGMDFRFVANTPRAVLFVVARSGRMPVVVVRVLRRSNAREDVVFVRVPVRARTPVLERVAAFVRFVTFVAARDTTDVSRDVAAGAEFVRDNESEPRTAADDAPNDSATTIMETVIPFISFKDKVSKK